MTRTKIKTEITGPLAERRTQDGRRRLKLNRAERDTARRQRLIEHAVALALDLENNYTMSQMAEQLGLPSIQAYKDLTRSQDYLDVYNAAIVEVGHHPRYKAVQGKLVDLLVKATNKLEQILDDPQAKNSDKLRAIETVFKHTGIGAKPADQKDDREELAEFEMRHAIFVLPEPEYVEAMRKYGLGEVVEGDFRVEEPRQFSAGSPEAPEQPAG